MTSLIWVFVMSFLLFPQPSRTSTTTSYSWQSNETNTTLGWTDRTSSQTTLIQVTSKEGENSNNSGITHGTTTLSPDFTVDANTTDVSNVSAYESVTISVNDTSKNDTQNATKVNSYRGPDMSIINNGLINKQQYYDATNALSFAVLPFLLLAFVFNIANISVYRKKEMKAPSQQYLMILSVLELLFVLCSVVLGIMAVIYKEKSTSTFSYLWYTIFISPTLTVSFRRCAFVINLLITLERFVVVSSPLKFRNFKLTRYPILLSLFIIFSCLIVHIPPALKFSINALNRPGSKETVYGMKITPFYLSNQHHIDALTTALNIIFVYIPLLSSFLLNVLIIIALKMHQKSQKSIKSNQTSEMSRQANQMTVTLVTSSFAFVLFSLPVSLNAILAPYLDDYGLFKREHYVFLLMFRVGFLCEIISNCTDFIFYFLLSSKFRGVFLAIYCRRTTKQPKKRSSVSSTKDGTSSTKATISTQASL